MEEAQASVVQFTTLVTEILKSNQGISQRLANIELQAARRSSNDDVKTLASMDASKNTKPTKCQGETGDSNSYQRCDTSRSIAPGLQHDDYTVELRNPTFGFTFDQDLHTSRVYARATNRHSSLSVSSSAIHSVGWSFLSGLSLADVSEISVIGLPISPQELWNVEHYIRALNTSGDTKIDNRKSYIGFRPQRKNVRIMSNTLPKFKRFLISQASAPARPRAIGSAPPKKIILLGKPIDL